MATGTKSTKLVIQLGNGATPTEVFAFTCGASSFTVTLANNTSETVSLDCADPLGVPAAMERFFESQDTSVTVSGKVTTQAFGTWREFADAGTARNVKILFDEASAGGGGFWIVPMMLSGLELSKEGGGTVDISATLVASGQRVWTPAT